MVMAPIPWVSAPKAVARDVKSDDSNLGVRLSCGHSLPNSQLGNEKRKPKWFCPHLSRISLHLSVCLTHQQNRFRQVEETTGRNFLVFAPTFSCGTSALFSGQCLVAVRVQPSTHGGMFPIHLRVFHSHDGFEQKKRGSDYGGRFSNVREKRQTINHFATIKTGMHQKNSKLHY